MQENDAKNSNLEERLKKLETLQRNTRIAIIILVGYSIYDVISKDSGSEIVYAHKVKAKQFELVDGIGTIYSSWKLLDVENRVAGLVIEGPTGNKIRMTPENIKLLEGRANPIERMSLDNKGLHLNEKDANP